MGGFNQCASPNTAVCNLKAFMQLETNPVTQLQMKGANSRNRTISKVKSHIMSIVKVQRGAPVHFRVGRCHQMKKRHYM